MHQTKRSAKTTSGVGTIISSVLSYPFIDGNMRRYQKVIPNGQVFNTFHILMWIT
nr:MAG TPA: hypothetical protein [Caudoviricetes sp.]